MRLTISDKQKILDFMEHDAHGLFSAAVRMSGVSMLEADYSLQNDKAFAKQVEERRKVAEKHRAELLLYTAIKHANTDSKSRQYLMEKMAEQEVDEFVFKIEWVNGAEPVTPDQIDFSFDDDE